LNNQTSADGYALAVGVGATVPLNKAIDFTLDASRQYGQKRVQDSDGNAVVAGLKYKF
jgi:outer membrane autotransporter protein